jgi:uncharacterized protein
MPAAAMALSLPATTFKPMSRQPGQENQTAKILEIDDAIVLLLGAPGATERDRGRIEGITRLEKLLFLLEMETEASSWLKEDADFRSDNFGPFSAKAYQEIENLTTYGLITDSATLSESAEDSWESEHIIGESGAEPYATRNLALTDKGRRYYQALLEELPPEAESVVSELKRRFGAIPLRRLIRYVYQRHPEFTDRSIIREDILGP